MRRISERWLHKMERSVPATMSEQPQDFVNSMEFIILNCLKKGEKKSCFYTLLNSTLASELLIKRERKAKNHRVRGSTCLPLS